MEGRKKGCKVGIEGRQEGKKEKMEVRKVNSRKSVRWSAVPVAPM